MPESLNQAAQLGTDQAFITRVTDALLAYAYVVENEGAGVTNHTARTAFASKVVGSPDNYGAELSRLIAAVDTGAAGAAYISTNPASSANVTDAQINSDVIVGFNLLAGL